MSFELDRTSRFGDATIWEYKCQNRENLERQKTTKFSNPPPPKQHFAYHGIQGSSDTRKQSRELFSEVLSRTCYSFFPFVCKARGPISPRSPDFNPRSHLLLKEAPLLLRPQNPTNCSSKRKQAEWVSQRKSLDSSNPNSPLSSPPSSDRRRLLQSASKAPNLNHTHTNKNPSLISRTILDQTFAVDFPFPQSWKLWSLHLGERATELSIRVLMMPQQTLGTWNPRHHSYQNKNRSLHTSILLFFFFFTVYANGFQHGGLSWCTCIPVSFFHLLLALLVPQSTGKCLTTNNKTNLPPTRDALIILLPVVYMESFVQESWGEIFWDVARNFSANPNGESALKGVENHRIVFHWIYNLTRRKLLQRLMPKVFLRYRVYICLCVSLSLSLALSLGFFFSGAFVEKIPAADFHQSLSPREHHLPVVLEDSFRSLQCILIRVLSP